MFGLGVLKRTAALPSFWQLFWQVMSHSDRVRNLFDRIAPRYDDLNDWLSLGQHRIWKQMTVKWSGAKPGDCGLDLCCGSGDLAFLLAEAIGPTGSVVAADFAPEMLNRGRDRWARRLGAARHWAAIAWVEADALALPFADASFEAVTMGYGLRNVSDLPRALAEVRRVLKPGGRAAFLDLHRPQLPIARQFQQIYLDRLVVPTARQFGLADDYAYLAPSLDRFPIGRDQVRLAQGAGFASAVHYPIVAGLMGVLVATA